jgi:hypothetical protein
MEQHVAFHPHNEHLRLFFKKMRAARDTFFGKLGEELSFGLVAPNTPWRGSDSGVVETGKSAS